MSHEIKEHEKHEHGFGIYFIVWGALLFLTLTTVGISFIDLKKFAIFGALFVATIKVTLVLLYFMHVRTDKPVIWIMIGAWLFTYLIFIGLTFVDYPFRT
jgi:cytochrome c oxidase subunit 4